jgi:outer membrane protein assembly factor BamB
MRNIHLQNRFILHIFLLLSILFFNSCGGGKTPSNIDVPTDSTNVSDTTATEKIITSLPDTSYASVAKIKYSIDTISAEIDQTIDNLNDLYTDAPGIFAFRGNPKRQANFGGTVSGTPDTIIIDWEFHTAQTPPNFKSGKWGGGTGWTGQPLYVKWPEDKLNAFAANGLTNAEFSGEEIIVGSLCHTLYFIDFKTGKASRQPIDVGNPIKGTPSLDPTLNGNLYVGQGIPDKRPFGNLVVDLNQGKITRHFPEDRKARRSWGAFDSSPIRVGQFLFWAGENGTLYKYLIKDADLELVSTLRYTVGGAAPGMEASIAVYRNYGYTADNHGHILCTNLNTMRPVWYFDNGDDTDATIVVSEENGHPYVYVCCEIDRIPRDASYFRKLDALTGELVWEYAAPGRRFNIEKKHFDGGYYATPLLGRGNCADLIFCNQVKNLKGQNGDFVAISKATGELVYTIPLKHYAWSSPVGLLNENGEMFIFTGDTYGNVYLINGRDGKVLYTQHVGNNFESSPIVIGNQVVVGSRGHSIYKMSIQ